MTRKKWSAVFAVAIATLSVAACGGEKEQTGGPAPTGVQLGEQNESGQSGRAELEAADGKTVVNITLDNAPGNPQPAHIHEGTCEELGDVAYPLTNVEDGASESSVDVSTEDLSTGEYAINVHKSEAEIETYVACGNIPPG